MAKKTTPGRVKHFFCLSSLILGHFWPKLRVDANSLYLSSVFN